MSFHAYAAHSKRALSSHSSTSPSTLGPPRRRDPDSATATSATATSTWWTATGPWGLTRSVPATRSSARSRRGAEVCTWRSARGSGSAGSARLPRVRLLPRGRREPVSAQRGRPASDHPAASPTAIAPRPLRVPGPRRARLRERGAAPPAAGRPSTRRCGAG